MRRNREGKSMSLVNLSNATVEQLAASVGNGKERKDYGAFLDAALNFPSGTFTEVGDTMADGHGICVNITFDSRLAPQLQELAGRFSIEKLFERTLAG